MIVVKVFLILHDTKVFHALKWEETEIMKLSLFSSQRTTLIETKNFMDMETQVIHFPALP